MPIYEYECKACGARLEKLQKISDAPLTDCPSCSRSELTKLVSASAFRLKGGGWYETDFKTGAKKNVASGSDTSAAPATGSSSDSGGSSGGGAASSDSGTKSDSKAGDSKSSNTTAAAK